MKENLTSVGVPNLDTKLELPSTHRHDQDSVYEFIDDLCVQIMNGYTRNIGKGDVHDNALKKSIHSAIKNNIEVLECTTHIDRQLVVHMKNDRQWIDHMKKQTFMRFADDIYNSDNYRVRESASYASDSKEYTFQIALVNLKRY